MGRLSRREPRKRGLELRPHVGGRECLQQAERTRADPRLDPAASVIARHEPHRPCDRALRKPERRAAAIHFEPREMRQRQERDVERTAVGIVQRHRAEPERGVRRLVAAQRHARERTIASRLGRARARHLEQDVGRRLERGGAPQEIDARGRGRWRLPAAHDACGALIRAVASYAACASEIGGDSRPKAAAAQAMTAVLTSSQGHARSRAREQNRQKNARRSQRIFPEAIPEAAGSTTTLGRSPGSVP